MNILYIGDVMGAMGIAAVERALPLVRSDYQVDAVIAQAENVTDGKGLSVIDYQRLRNLGIDGFTGGNHTTALPETATLLNDANVPVVAPANMQEVPGPGFKYISTP